MNWGMEVLSPASYISKASWLIDESGRTEWTHAENKLFEDALAVYDKDTPDRWQKVAEMIPGKTVSDVIKQYRELEDDVCKIEAGLLPIREYSTSPFTLEWVNHHTNNGFDGFKYTYGPGSKRGPGGARPSDQERKKGVPWTEEEHKLFLMGLKKYGKGDWRNISRNFVVTRTPTQVASHAQKYFIRQLSGGKDKRRASIHDITTSSLDTQASTASPDSKRSDSPESSSTIHNQQQQCHSGFATGVAKTASLQWNESGGNAAAIGFNAIQGRGNVFMDPYGMYPYGMQMQGHSEFIGHSQNMGF